MKHIYNFSNMGGRKCQVVTSTELTPELLAKYKKVLGIACTHSVEPMGNDIARPVITDKGLRPMSRIEELLEAWNGGYYSTLEVHELIDTLKLELDQMTARCSRLLWAAEHFDEVDECEKIMADHPTGAYAYSNFAWAATLDEEADRIEKGARDED